MLKRSGEKVKLTMPPNEMLFGGFSNIARSAKRFPSVKRLVEM